MADIAALSEELANDPLGRGYSGMTDQEAADDLNTAYRTRNRASLSGDEIFQQTDPSEFSNLEDGSGNNTADVKGQWLAFCGRNSVDPFATANVQFVTQVFGSGSVTVSNLADARVVSITRAEELGILGSSPEIGPAHVARARA